jgi:hypothetical protein
VSERRDDSHGEGHDPREEVGSLADEAVRLFGALSDWARDATEEVTEHVDTGSPECTWCPVCRTVHAVRQAAPEVRGHLAVAASALLQAAAGVLATVAQASGSPGQAGTGVEHIDLDRDIDGDLDGDPDADSDGARPGEDDR